MKKLTEQLKRRDARNKATVSAKGNSVRQGIELISTGSNELDCALGGGVAIGRITNIVGDKATAKSLLCSEIIHQARKKYKDKMLWEYDDAEAGYSFNSVNMYGFEILKDEDSASETVEEFMYRFEKKIDSVPKNKRMIYVLDSLDSLATLDEIKLHKENKKILKKKDSEGINNDAKLKGSYGMSKPKELGKFFRLMRKKIKKSQCALIIVSQVRENIGVQYGPKYRRAGGKALDFYSSQICWLAEVEKKKKGEKVIGVTIKPIITKNKIGLPFRSCFVDVLFDYGVDPIFGSLCYLYDLRAKDGKMKKDLVKKKIKYNSKSYKLSKLIRHIEERNLEEELRQKVVNKWQAGEAAIKTNRKRKF